MKVNQLIPEVNLRVQFSLRLRKIVPVKSGCYVLTTFNDEVLYIGLTDNLHRRFTQHRDSKAKREETPQGTAFWFYYLTMERSRIFRVERTWLNQHLELHGTLPILNKINSPIR